MSIESARLFLHRMKTDEDFARKINSCKDFGARWNLIRAAGFDFTAEEIHGNRRSQKVWLLREELPGHRNCYGWLVRLLSLLR